MAVTAGGRGVVAVDAGAGADADDPPCAGSVIGEGMGDRAAVDVGDGAGEPGGPASVVAGCEGGEAVAHVEPDIEEPPSVDKELAGGTDRPPGFGGGSNDAPPAGSDATVGEDGVSATKTGEGVGEPPKSRVPDVIGALATDVEPGVGSATWGGGEIGDLSPLKIQCDSPTITTRTPASAAAKLLPFLSLIGSPRCRPAGTELFRL